MAMDTNGLAFPKPHRRAKKATREQNPQYVWWIHGWECVVPGCVTSWPVHAHHVERRSQGGSDMSCIPLCHNHHVGDHGIHVKGVLTFERMFNIQLLQKVLWFNEAWHLAKRGPKQDLLPPFGSSSGIELSSED